MIPLLFHSCPRYDGQHWTSGWSSQFVLLFRVQVVQVSNLRPANDCPHWGVFPQSLQANAATCVSSGFHRGVNEFLALPGYYASQIGSQLKTFRDNLYGYHLQWLRSPKSLKCLTLEDGTETSVTINVRRVTSQKGEDFKCCDIASLPVTTASFLILSNSLLQIMVSLPK